MLIFGSHVLTLRLQSRSKSSGSRHNSRIARGSREHNSVAVCPRKLFKRSKDSASVVVCNEKRNWLRVADFLRVTS